MLWVPGVYRMRNIEVVDEMAETMCWMGIVLSQEHVLKVFKDGISARCGHVEKNTNIHRCGKYSEACTIFVVEIASCCYSVDITGILKVVDIGTCANIYNVETKGSKTLRKKCDTVLRRFKSKVSNFCCHEGDL